MVPIGKLISTWSHQEKESINRKGRLFFDSYNPCIFPLECGIILPTEVTEKKPSPSSIGLARSETPLPFQGRDEPISFLDQSPLPQDPSIERSTIHFAHLFLTESIGKKKGRLFPLTVLDEKSEGSVHQKQ
jgi:hypothetical protein